jgi:DNA-binding CsgD family transcriptional regulator
VNEHLGERESQCLHLIASGLSNKEIGVVMSISEKTVGAHVRKVLRKVGANNRYHAVALAYRRGWLDLERCADVAAAA